MKPVHERFEITKEILQAMLLNLHQNHDDINLRAAFCVAFAGFLRLSEFTWSHWDTQSSFLQHLSRGSIQFVAESVLLQLPASKTDPFRKDVSIPLSPSGDTTCPVSALRTLFDRYPLDATAPLFCRSYGPFDRDWVLRKITQTLLFAGINPKGFTDHSFRRGAANSAFRAGIPQSEIKKMGCWKSDSISRYFPTSTTNTHLFSLSTKLHATPGPSSLPSDSRRSRSLHTTPRSTLRKA